MPSTTPADLRNVALVGHSASGKTTLSEAILFTAKSITRMGTITDGNTVSDYHPDEIQREVSISSTLMHFEWGERRINLIDTPGYTDFTGEAKSGLSAVDNAVVVLNGQNGMEVGTEIVWSYAEEFNLPRALVVNGLQREHADFDGVLEQVRERLGNGAVAVQLPANPGEGFNAVIDLINMQQTTYESAGDGRGTSGAIDESYQDEADTLREQLVEAVAELNEELLEKYLEDGDLDQDTLVTGLRNAVAKGDIFPILCADAAANIGTSQLLDRLVDLMASPVERGATQATPDSGDGSLSLAPDPGDPMASRVFKLTSEKHIGELSFVRVYSGTLTSGTDVMNTTQSHGERIGQMYHLTGHTRSETHELVAGDIGALVKLKGTHAGDTLCDKTRQAVLPATELPKPNIRVAISPRSKGDEDKIGDGLHSIHEEDPTFRFEFDPELHQTLIFGQGELHLEVVIRKLKERYHVEVDQEEPRIPYRETIKRSADSTYRHKKQSGGRGQFGEVSIRVEPKPRGEDNEFVNEVVGGVIPSKFIPAVEKGVVEALEDGVLTHSIVVDVQATVFDGSHHAVDSSEIAFKIAGGGAFKQAMEKASPMLLEPIYSVEVTVPDEYMGDVMGDMSGRRGRIQGTETIGHFTVVKARVPLAELFRYSTHLRSMTGGRGLHTREFSHYEEVPADEVSKVKEDAAKRWEEEHSS